MSTAKRTGKSSAKDSWQIKCIVDGPKYEVIGGKRETFYKVRWCESYEPVANLPPEEVEHYNEKRKANGAVQVLGPYVENPKKKRACNDLHSMDFAVRIGDKIAVMTYSEVKQFYADELMVFYEKNAVLNKP
ncbi:hypothetical protein AAVH_28480 [Aphelenchoides avenae]|nr:hypothetical protein AAVH_28480 [Aphelenchus avenae]